MLKIEVLPQNATNKTLTFSSSNPQVVNVDSSGKLHAIGAGTATITAKAKNNVTGSIKISVYSKVTGLELQEDELCMQVGQNYKLQPVVLPSDATNPKVNYVVENMDIASIDENGNIKALAPRKYKNKSKNSRREF